MHFAFLANLVFIVSWLYFCIYTTKHTIIKKKQKKQKKDEYRYFVCMHQNVKRDTARTHTNLSFSRMYAGFQLSFAKHLNKTRRVGV